MGVSSKVRYNMGNLKVLLSWCPRLNFVVARTFSERICYSNVENETICTPLSKVIAYGTWVLMTFRLGSDVKDSFPKNHVTQWRVKKCSGVNFIHILLKVFSPMYFCQNVTEKLREAFSYEKRSRKMLMKSTPGPKNIQIDRNIRK